MAEAVLVVDEVERAARLAAQFNITEEQLRQAIIEGDNARSGCSMNHPPLYKGMVFWGETVRALRDHLATAGYGRHDAAGFSSTLNKALGVAIVLTAGDEGTGVVHGNGASKYPRGTMTLAALERNAEQLELFPGYVVTVPEEELRDDAHVTWFLLHYKNDALQQIQVELSLPVRLDDDARLREFRERIILAPIPYSANASVPTPSTPPSFTALDVPVEKLPEE